MAAQSSPGSSPLASYVLDRLPAGYLLTPADLAWLDECGRLLIGPPTHRSVTEATHSALRANPRGHVDPFELLIDAKICDTAGEPLPE